MQINILGRLAYNHEKLLLYDVPLFYLGPMFKKAQSYYERFIPTHESNDVESVLKSFGPFLLDAVLSLISGCIFLFLVNMVLHFLEMN